MKNTPDDAAMKKNNMLHMLTRSGDKRLFSKDYYYSMILVCTKCCFRPYVDVDSPVLVSPAACGRGLIVGMVIPNHL